MKHNNTTPVSSIVANKEDRQYELAFIISGILCIVGIVVGATMQLLS